MIFLRSRFLIIFLIPGLFTYSQKLKKADKEVIANLQKHVTYLADEKLEGRRTGSHGETMAMEYIRDEFQQIGLLPKGNDGFFQPFEIYDGKQIDSTSYLFIKGKALKREKDFFPFAFSANASIQAQPALALQEADMPWFFNLRETLEENKGNTAFKLEAFIKGKIKEVQKKGASALVFYNTSDVDDQLCFNKRDKSLPVSIPVIYVTKENAKKYFSDVAATIDVKMNVAISERKRTGHNVAGYIDNNAPVIAVLGAHFDHLGYGEDSNSLTTSHERIIHNGADDNASGTAALIEIARLLKNSKLKNANFLFLAFSGRETGMLGSNYFVDNPTVDLSTVNYMINMDMVGRFNDTTHGLTIGGIKTSPGWDKVITATNKKSFFSITTDSSSAGDHSPFHKKEIPVLVFFTGLGPDYHRPTDVAEKINYTGEFLIVHYINDIISLLDKQNQKLAFTKAM